MPDQSSAATEHAIIQEITGPLQTLPDDPVALVHAEFPSALRGYDREAVDDYVEQVSRLVAELQATRSPEAAVRRALERVGEQISGVLQRAHETAEQITAQSRREAEDRLEQARLEAARIGDAAEQRVKDLDGDTDRIWLERQRIVADAEDLATQLVTLAKTAADRFPADEELADVTDRTTPYDEEDAAGPDLADEAPTAALPSTPAEEAPTAGTPSSFTEEASTVPEEASTFTQDAPGDEGDAAVYDDGPPLSEGSEYAEGGDDEEDFFEDDEAATGVEDVTKTVAFSPLDPRGGDAGVDPRERGHSAGAQDEGRDDAPGVTDRRTKRDSSSIIPPASQAANRRQRP